MEVWKTIILIILVLGVFLFGYFLMACLDKFLYKNRKAIEKENEKQEPSCIILTEYMSDEEVAEAVKQFRDKHESIRIVLYDNSDMELPDCMESYAGHKQ